MFRLLSGLMDLILPPRASARRVEKLRPEELSTLLKEGRSKSEFSFLLPYRDPRVTALIWEMKYRRNPRALELLPPLVGAAAAALAEESLGTPLFIPMPMHLTRRRERGYNQTELLWEHLPEDIRRFFIYAPRALERVRHTPPQQGLPRAERLEQLRGSMRATDTALVADRTCVVFDDVATTGATFEEARRALMEAGAQKVYCLAIAG